MAAVTAVPLHQCAMATGTDCNVVSTGKREMEVLTAVTAVSLHQCSKDTGTD